MFPHSAARPAWPLGIGFAMNNFYALDRLEVPGREAMANLAGRARGTYGPTSFADGCAERMALVPVQAELRQLPDAADPALPFDALLLGAQSKPGETTDQLSNLLRFTYGLLRWEPFNDFKQHRAVASPRSLYPLALYVVVGNGRDRVFRYLPAYHALMTCLGLRAPDGFDQGLIVVERLGHLPPYGELTPMLNGVESGALTRQIALVAHLQGQQATLRPDILPHLRPALGLDHWSDCPSVAVALEGVDFSAAVRSVNPVETTVMIRAPRHAEMDVHRRLRAYVESAEAGSAPGYAAAPDAGETQPLPQRGLAPSREPFATVVRRRSSGCRVGGLSGHRSKNDNAGMADLLADAAALRSVGVRRSGPALRLFATVLNDAKLPPGDYEVATEGIGLRAIAVADRSGLHSFESYYEINFSTLAAVFTIACDLGGPDAAHPAFFGDAHRAAGTLVQEIGLAAAATGHFARPYRSFRGPVMQGVLDQACEPLLQIVVGRNRRHNLRIAVAGAGQW